MAAFLCSKTQPPQRWPYVNLVMRRCCGRSRATKVTVAYLRVSTGSQDLANQKMAVLDYARQERFAVERFVVVQVSSRKNPAQRGIEELLGTLAEGDRLIVGSDN